MVVELDVVGLAVAGPAAAEHRRRTADSPEDGDDYLQSRHREEHRAIAGRRSPAPVDAVRVPSDRGRPATWLAMASNTVAAIVEQASSELAGAAWDAGPPAVVHSAHATTGSAAAIRGG